MYLNTTRTAGRIAAYQTSAISLVLVWLAAGCNSEGKSASDDHSGAKPAVAALAASSDATAATKAAPAKSSCPAGRWSYDYSDQALEVMMKNLAGAKVVKEEGSFVCEISEGKTGTINCSTQGKPVENVVETQQAGLTMTVSVKLDGSAITKFELLEGGHMKVVSSDTSKLKLATQVNLGGRNVPFPADKLISIFGDAESQLSYKCEGDKLLLKPEIDGAATWQELTPVK